MASKCQGGCGALARVQDVGQLRAGDHETALGVPVGARSQRPVPSSPVLREGFQLIDARAGQILDRLLEVGSDAHVPEAAGICDPDTLAFLEGNRGKQSPGEIALQGRKEWRQCAEVRPPCGAKEEPQTFRCGRIFHHAITVAQLSGHDAVIAGRG